MTPSHTPGPWLWQWIIGEDDDAGKEWIEIFDQASIDEIAVLMVRKAAKWRRIVGPQHEANARLIAQAPAMLAFVREVAEGPCPDGTDVGYDQHRCQRARAILRAVEG